MTIPRKLVRIIENLEPLSEEHGLLKFLKNADRANTLNGFVQDLACAITDYQVCANDGSYTGRLTRSADIYTTKHL